MAKIHGYTVRHALDRVTVYHGGIKLVVMSGPMAMACAGAFIMAQGRNEQGLIGTAFEHLEEKKNG